MMQVTSLQWLRSRSTKKLFCFSHNQQGPWNTHHEPKLQRSGHTSEIGPQNKWVLNWWVLNCAAVGVKEEKSSTNLRDVRVPINVANVFIGQPCKKIDQMLERRRTCYTENYDNYSLSCYIKINIWLDWLRKMKPIYYRASDWCVFC